MIVARRPITTPLETQLDRRRTELQIRTVLVTVRAENMRRDPKTMVGFRARAHLLLDELEDAATGFPDLQERIREARLEIDRGLS